jgi:hypothetical protein
MGNQVEQVEKRGEVRDGQPDARVGREVGAKRRQRGAQAPHRPGQADLRVDDGIGDVLPQHYKRAHARDEEWRARVDAEPSQHRHMAHLVDVDRHDQAERQRPAVDDQ